MDKSKYQLLIKKSEDAGIKYLNDPRAFIEYSNTMADLCNIIDDYNPKRKRKILIVFNDMIADISTNKRFQFIVKELFIWHRKLNLSFVFITKSYFLVPKYVRLNSTHCLIMKIHSKKKLQSIANDHSADIDYEDFMNIYTEYTYKPYSFFTIHTTLPVIVLNNLEKIF